jgi:hypothetical protein
MLEPVSLLMIQFLDWVASRPRTYAEAMDAWRTSCPRLSVWEDALISGFIEVNGAGATQQAEVALTPRGRAVLDESQGRGSAQSSPGISAEPAATPD